MVDIQQLRFAYWYVNHREQIVRWLIIFFILMSVWLYGYASYVFIIQFGVYRQNNVITENTLGYDLVAYDSYKQALPLQEPRVISTQVIRTAPTKYDLLIRVKNDNPQWFLSSFDYVVATDTDTSKPINTFLLPGEERTLAVLGFATTQGVGAIRPSFENMQWKRILNYPDTLQQKFRFTVNPQSVSFIQRPAAYTNASPVSTVSFSVKNDSAFSYWNVGFNITVRSGGQIIAFTTVHVNEFLSGQEKTVSTNWFTPIPGISSPQVSIEPFVDILSSDAFIQPSTGL